MLSLTRPFERLSVSEPRYFATTRYVPGLLMFAKTFLALSLALRSTIAERIFVPFRLSVNFTFPATSVAFSDVTRALPTRRWRASRTATDAVVVVVPRTTVNAAVVWLG